MHRSCPAGPSTHDREDETAEALVSAHWRQRMGQLRGEDIGELADTQEHTHISISSRTLCAAR